MRAIVLDPRFSQLGAPAQSILLAAVIRRSDADGMFFEKQAGLGRLVGRSDRAVRTALAEAVQLGLLTKEAYLRPDGKRGSNTYRVDPALLKTSPEETFLTCEGTSQRKEPSGGQERKQSSGGQERTKPSGQDEKSLTETLDGVEAPSGLNKTQTCISCQRRLDEDEYAFCRRCCPDAYDSLPEAA